MLLLLLLGCFFSRMGLWSKNKVSNLSNRHNKASLHKFYMSQEPPTKDKSNRLIRSGNGRQQGECRSSRTPAGHHTQFV